MKIAASILTSLAATVPFASVVVNGANNACTHGKLYMFDNSTSDVHIFDVSNGMLQNLVEEATVTLPAAGAGELVVYGPPADPLIVQYRGQEATGFDGYVRVVDTGLAVNDDNGMVSYTNAAVVANAMIDDCNRPIHQVRHDGKIAIFCDGAFDFDPQMNTTIHVVDQSKLGSLQESAIVHSVTLAGTHHGVAIPVDDGHLLYSIPLPDRVLRVEGVSSLPSTFQVVDFEGNVLHEIADLSSPDTHCAGFHGSAAVDNTFLLACDATHGGIVIVEFDAAAGSYTSRAITYPDDEKFAGLRVGSFAYHKKSEYIVGSYSLRGGTEYHLLAISPADTTVDESNVVTLPGEGGQCAYQFDVGSGDHLYVFMPNGVLHVFEIKNGSFSEVAQKEIIPGMVTCSEAVFVAGIDQAFVAVPGTQTLYGIDLNGVEDGVIEVFESTLPFIPTGMTVSGFSLDAACGVVTKEDTGASAASIVGLFASAVVGCVLYW